MCKSFRIRCREIEVADIEGIVDLLTGGYRIRKRDFWARRLYRLSRHSPPPGFPKYGYVLDCDGTPVGVILTLFSTTVIDEVTKIRCYLSSWYVQPVFRNYAQMLASHALKYKDVTYLNITSTPQVRPILEAQGYLQFCSGRFVAIPALSRSCHDARVELATPDSCSGDGLQSWESELLVQHANFGCINLLCTTASGEHRFVFQPRLKAGMARFVRLIYCPHFEDFVRFAGPLGRFLASRGFPLVLLDANGPIEGLRGKYSSGHPKYFKGPDQPRLGDMAYSTRVIFDF